MRHTTDARHERAITLRLVRRHARTYREAAYRYVSYRPSPRLTEHNERMLVRAEVLDDMAKSIRWQLAPLPRESICEYCTSYGIAEMPRHTTRNGWAYIESER